MIITTAEGNESIQGFHNISVLSSSFHRKLRDRHSQRVAGTEKTKFQFWNCYSIFWVSVKSKNTLEMDIPLQPIGKDILLGKVVIEKIILISNKKMSKDAIKYLQVEE